MEYPERLIPKPHFTVIDGYNQNGQYFIRHFECEPGKELRDYIDPAINLIDPKCVADPTDHVVDYSVNLHGEFLPEDVRFKITNNKQVLHHPWRPGENGTKPREDEYRENPHRKPLCFAAEVLYLLNEDLKEDDVRIQVEHKPVRCNYWHFTINWFHKDELMKRKKKKRLLGAIRILLQKKAALDKSRC